MLADIRTALGAVFGGWRFRALALALSLLLFAVYVSVPVFAIPGNSYGFYLKITPPYEIAAIAVLSLLMGIELTMQAYAWRHNIHRLQHAGAGIAGLVSGSAAALFSTATCASCMSALFSFIGFGGMAFMIQHRMEMMAATLALLGASFYFTSKRIAGKCASCGIPYPQEPVHEGEKKEGGK